MKRPAAFTLIELLVVVAIIALLIAILLPSLGRAREQSRRAVCAANLKAIGTAVAVYAAENSDNLPVLGTASVYWWWDLTFETADALANATARSTNNNPDTVRRIFYCPSNTAQNSFKNTSGLDLWDAFGYRVIGYAYYGPRPSGASLPTPIGSGSTTGAQQIPNPPPAGKSLLPPVQIYTRFTTVTHAGLAPLAGDAILSRNANPLTADDWTDTGGYQISPGVYYLHTSSHMDGARPAGGTVLLFDGHAEWRPWRGASSASGIGTSADALTHPFFWTPFP